jgi:glucose-6-phosphate isomerase
MANWVFRDFSSLYEPIRKFGGGAYFLLESGFVRNPDYCFVPEIRRLEPLGADLVGLSKGEDMYVLVENLQNLRFLKGP